MANFDTISKKRVEENPQDFVDLCFQFRSTNIIGLKIRINRRILGVLLF